MREKPFLLIISVLVAWAGLAWAEDAPAAPPSGTVSCTECKNADIQLKEKMAKKERTADILKKNQEYLKKNPDAPKSVGVKVKSNVMVCMLQIETVDNEITALKTKYEPQRCTTCQN